MRRLIQRVKAFFVKKRLDRDLENELAAHLDFAIEENLERGLSLEQARREALVKIGGIQQARERHREARGLMKIDIFMYDLRYTIRTLRRDLGFTIAAVLILALGIGANVAVFSVVNTLLLRPLPFPDSQQLVWIAPPPTKCGLSCATYSTDAYDEFRARNHSYQDVTGYFAFSSPNDMQYAAGSERIPANGIYVIGNFFQTLGVKPALGRLFNAEDKSTGSAPVVLLTDVWWRQHLNADPAIVGRTIELNNQQVTVIGVLPPSFDFGSIFSPGERVDMFEPFVLDVARDWGNIVTLIGRLKPGISLPQAQADADLVRPKLCWSEKQPLSCGSYKPMFVNPLKNYVSGRLRRALIVLWCAVGAILLIACVNLSNLLLARAAARQKEFAMRSALGAGRGRILGQLLTESLVLSGMGAVCGLGLAWAMIRWLAHQESIALPLLNSLRIDGAALGWTVLVAVVAAFLFGLLPGIRMASGNLIDALKDSGPGSGQGRRQERVRSILVVSEVALACVLLVSAGLLLRSFLKVLDIDLGFQPERAAAITVDYSYSPSDPNPVQTRTATYQRIIQRVSALPGVEAAGFVDYLPLGQNRSWNAPVPKGSAYDSFKLPSPLVYMVTPGYVRAMGIRLRGRDFTWDDGPKSQPVMLVNEAVAQFFWPHGDAVGKTVQMANRDTVIVGVVDDVHQVNVEESPDWQVYFPQTQQSPEGSELVVRSTLPPATLGTAVLHALRELNPNQSAAEFKPLEMLVDHANSPRRFFMLMVASFAGLGLLLAAIGIYGVISYTVTRQTQEIGIRMALGATMGRVQRQVLSSTLRLAIIGISLGAAVSLAAAKLIASLLFATSPWDGITYVAMAFALLAVAFVAGYLPARRASRIDPMVALRAN